MINLADINRAGHWMNTHKIPLLPKVMQLIAFLFYSSAVSYKVKIGKGLSLIMEVSVCSSIRMS